MKKNIILNAIFLLCFCFVIGGKKGGNTGCASIGIVASRMKTRRVIEREMERARQKSLREERMKIVRGNNCYCCCKVSMSFLIAAFLLDSVKRMSNNTVIKTIH